MKLTITVDLGDLKNKPMDDWNEEDDATLEDIQASKNPDEVVLPKDEAMVEPPDTKPVIYTVKKGDKLKDICKKYGVSFGELTNYMMAKQGSTMITPGMEIEIPRHFIDLTEAGGEE
jgi:hypothetical protein